MLALKAVDHFYGDSHTLWGIDLVVKPQKCTCLMGRNGVGKTTLLKTIMGQEKIGQGEIVFKNQAIEKQKTQARAGLGISIVPQGRQIFPLLTVEENIKLAFQAANKTGAMPQWVLDLFPVLNEMKDRLGGNLSGGQQQQLAIVRALITEPELLLLDEPCEGIQPNIVAAIGEVIRYLVEERGMTVLLVEQKLQFIKKVADHFYIIDRGSNKVNGEINTLNDDMIKNYLTV
ncbi:MAG: urea ABC transporter ATP-binding subunit UrtE [Cellvibrionales bacterium]|nr:urea ABC transporter ATP-binding subunit UrtE [Cellvibrionales bacterium]